MRVLVSGGGGFLGFHVVIQLMSQGYEVIVLSRNRYEKVEKIGAKSISVDICDYEKILPFFEGIDEVYHVAAIADMGGPWSRFYNINFIGTQNVINACKIHKVPRLIYTSSPSVVFDGHSQKNLNEKTDYPKQWLAHYPHSKMLAEQLVLSSNCASLQTVALRPHLIWGPGDPHIFPRLIKKAKQGRLAVVGNGQNTVDIVFVENAAKAHLLAAKALKESGLPAGKAYFLGQNEPVKLWEFIGQVLEREGLPPLKKQIPFFVVYSLGFLFELVFKLLKLEREPPMTRFIACQLSKDHYYSHKNAAQDFGYTAEISIEAGLEQIYGPKKPNASINSAQLKR